MSMLISMGSALAQAGRPPRLPRGRLLGALSGIVLLALASFVGVQLWPSTPPPDSGSATSLGLTDITLDEAVERLGYTIAVAGIPEDLKLMRVAAFPDVDRVTLFYGPDADGSPLTLSLMYPVQLSLNDESANRPPDARSQIVVDGTPAQFIEGNSVCGRYCVSDGAGGRIGAKWDYSLSWSAFFEVEDPGTEGMVGVWLGTHDTEYWGFIEAFTSLVGGVTVVR